MTEAIIEEVLRRIRLAQRPGALLLGEAPPEDTGYRYVTQPPYQAVLLGSVDAQMLLSFPDRESLQALLEGKPVYLYEPGERWRQYQKTASRELYAALLQARRRMLRLGVQPLRSQAPASVWLTARELQRRQAEGLPITGRLTPLARELLEGERG